MALKPAPVVDLAEYRARREAASHACELCGKPTPTTDRLDWALGGVVHFLCAMAAVARALAP